MKKNCIITGATDGIGKQTAIDLANLGYNLGLIGRNKEKGMSVVEEIENSTGNKSIKYLRKSDKDYYDLKSKIDLLSKNLKN